MITDLLKYSDDLGPIKIINIYNPKNGLKATLAIDNVAAGPSIGGIRMAPDVTQEEAFRLARAMTLKNAAAGLAHGGGKAVIQADPKTLTPKEKELLIRSFARAIKDLKEYIPGPDMGTDETCMAWINDEIGRSVGLPKEIGGIPLDEIGATAHGILAAAMSAEIIYNLPIEKATVAIQGFGAVGMHSAKLLSQKGAIIIAVADSKGTITNESGLDVDELISIKRSGRSVITYKNGITGNTEDIIHATCDIWIPAARPDVITVQNVSQLNTKLIIQGANIPITDEAERILYEKGVHVIPDFIANAGGVICAAVEYSGGTEQGALEIIHQKVGANTTAILSVSINNGISPRDAANQYALENVKKAMMFRRF